MRTKAEIDQDYSDTCAQVGHLMVERGTLDIQINQLMAKIKDLGAETKAIYENQMAEVAKQTKETLSENKDD